MSKLKLFGLSPAASALILHYLAIFGLAFGAQLLAGASGHASISTLAAGLTSAVAAGIVALLRALTGINTLETSLANAGKVGAISIPPAIKSKLYVVGMTLLATFLTTFGTGLVTGIYGKATSMPILVNAITSALASAIAAVVAYVLSFVKAPAPIPPVVSP